MHSSLYAPPKTPSTKQASAPREPKDKKPTPNAMARPPNPNRPPACPRNLKKRNPSPVPLKKKSRETANPSKRNQKPLHRKNQPNEQHQNPKTRIKTNQTSPVMPQSQPRCVIPPPAPTNSTLRNPSLKNHPRTPPAKAKPAPPSRSKRCFGWARRRLKSQKSTKRRICTRRRTCTISIRLRS